MRYVWLLAVCAVAVWQLWSRYGVGEQSERNTSAAHTRKDGEKRSQKRSKKKRSKKKRKTTGSKKTASKRGSEGDPVPAASKPQMNERVRIGSWNLRRLGHGDKRLDWVAQVIEREFDIVALQEVMTEESVGDLIERLPGWAPAVSPKSVGTDKYQEWYAVLFRSAEAKVTRSFLVKDRKNEMMREPFVVCMRVYSFDFCLVDNHIVFGDRARERDAEIHALGNKLIGLRKQSDERDWLVVGDFNRMPKAPGWDKLRASGWDFTLPGRIPTSLGKKGYASPYDHILVDRTHTGELLGAARRIDIIKTPCAGDLDICRTELSDHAPIVVSFRTSGDDDD